MKQFNVYEVQLLMAHMLEMMLTEAEDRMDRKKREGETA